jgi:hypothetical protein
MACEFIEGYLNSVLRAQLDGFGVDTSFTERILNTVREQIYSCVYHWNDEAFRKTLLLIGSEEGAFYKPYADDDIRNFVVVAIRNSEIESAQSSKYKEAGLQREIGDDGVMKITSTAIEYFKSVHFSELQSIIEPPANDIYYDLSRK